MSQTQRALSMLFQQPSPSTGQDVQGAGKRSGPPPGGPPPGPPPSGGASGQFALNTLSSLLSAQEDASSSSDIATSLISQADTDGDGLLSADEIAASMGTGANDELSSAIAKLDSDGDGKLSADELTSGLDAAQSAHHAHRGHGARPSSEGMAAKLLSDSDSDGDGLLSTEEISAKLAGGASSDLASAVGGLDTDGDGKLSASELSAAMDAFKSAHARGYGQTSGEAAQASALA